MEGCTFRPHVNPPPLISNSPAPIAMKNPESYKPVIDNLIKEELESTRKHTDGEDRISPRIITLLKKSVEKDMQRSGDKVYERLY